jgi:HAMP domain-containing protein
MKRRLIGPTVIATTLCLVLLQHLFFGDKGWSLLGVLGNVLSVIAAILTPPEPVISFFHTYLALPLAVVGTALVVVWMILAGARKTMRQVTPDVEAPVWELPVTSDTTPAGEPAEDAPDLSWSLQAFRFNCLRSKLILGFLAISLFVAVAAASFTYSYLYRAMERGAKMRAAVTAMAINAVAVGHIDGKRYQELRNELTKATTRPAIAYAYVEDGDGKLIAHAPKDLPNQLIRRPLLEARLMTAEQLVGYRGEIVYDFAQRSGLNNQFIVHLGIWQDSVAVETWSVLGPILLAVVLAILCAAGVFSVLLRDLHRPLLEMVEQSTRISKGDFSMTLTTKRSDELGDLARSLERMRSSLRAVLSRIGTEPTATPSDRKRQSY